MFDFQVRDSSPDSDIDDAFNLLLRDITGTEIDINTHVKDMYVKLISHPGKQGDILHYWQHSLEKEPCTSSVYMKSLMKYLRGDMNDLNRVQVDDDD